MNVQSIPSKASQEPSQLDFTSDEWRFYSIIEYLPSPMSANPGRPLSPGKRIKDFVLGDPIGSGAFSTVYKCTNSESQIFAMKVIPRDNIQEEADSKRLQVEIDATAFLRHPNICNLKSFFSDAEFYYLVMDYCQGGNLEEYIVTHECLREATAACAFQQIVSALQLCHARKLAHRDLKLQNILITVFPTVKVADFGFASHVGDQKMKTFCGSPAYSAPECLNLKEYNGELADCWSLGVILYEMVTKRSPWQLSNIALMAQQIKACQYSFPTHLSPQCRDLISHLLTPIPFDRLRCEQILNHPWIRSVARRSGVGSKPVLPPLTTMGPSVLEWAQSLERKGERRIFSPFDGGVLAGGTAPKPMVKMMSRSASCGFQEAGLAAGPGRQSQRTPLAGERKAALRSHGSG
jgi:serine/threonine protein kinase